MIQKLLEFIKNHPQLVVAQDFEVACQKMKTTQQHYLNGQPSIQNVDEAWWVQLKVLHRNKAGVSVTMALGESSLDRLVFEALSSAEKSSRNPWFRFPVWSVQTNERSSEGFEPPPDDFWNSSRSQLDTSNLFFQEKYEWSDIETVLYRRSEKLQKSYRRTAAFQQWSSDGFHDSFWGKESREKRIQLIKGSAVCLEGCTGWTGAHPKIISLSGKAMSPLLHQISNWFCADRIQSKQSPLAVKEEKSKIMSDLVTLVDDGAQIRSVLSGPFDLDGISEQKTSLVTKGFFQGVLYDAHTSAVNNCRSTGNKVRHFLEPEPGLRAKAFCLEPGTVSDSELWKQLETGFAIVGWNRTDFSSNRRFQGDAYGWKVKNGSISGAYFLEGIQFDLLDFMNQIIALAREAEKHGFTSSPTVFIKGEV